MVSYEAPGQDLELCFGAGFAKGFEEELAISIVEVNILAPITAAALFSVAASFLQISMI